MKNHRRDYNKWYEKERKSLFFIFLFAFGIMLMNCCSYNNNKTVSAPDMELGSDSTTQELLSEQVEVTETPAASIFDKLANDMVCVENDTGCFYICKYEVTQKLWKEVMNENPSQIQGDDLPVEQVNWNDCQTFVSKLNKLTGKHYRLPTEAEWEYACKGGKYSKGYKYSGSDNIDEVAWYDGNSEGKSHPVGRKLPNELGLYDMSGNVWEWCQDMQDGTGMCRGGSWIHNARNCDPSLPNETPQSFYINCLGLRLAY